MPAPQPPRNAALAAGLRGAVAGALCVAVVEVLGLASGYVSVITVAVIVTETSKRPFQKGLERTLGRVGGVFCCTLLLMLFGDAPAVCLALVAAVLIPVCYVQASDHLAYSALLAAVFMSQTVAAGITSPRGTVAEAFLPMAAEILLGRKA